MRQFAIITFSHVDSNIAIAPANVDYRIFHNSYKVTVVRVLNNHQGYFKEPFDLVFQNHFRKISATCPKSFCHFHTYDER